MISTQQQQLVILVTVFYGFNFYVSISFSAGLPKIRFFLYDASMFFPTAQEVLLLKLIQKNDMTMQTDDPSIHQNPQMLRVLEGCLEKGFVNRDKTGILNLTEKGLACI